MRNTFLCSNYCSQYVMLLPCSRGCAVSLSHANHAHFNIFMPEVWCLSLCVTYTHLKWQKRWFLATSLAFSNACFFFCFCFVSVETVIFQLRFYKTQTFPRRLLRSTVFKHNRGHVGPVLAWFLSFSIQVGSIAITWIKCSLAAVSAVAVLRLRPAIYQAYGSSGLSGQLTSSRLMSC